MKYVCYISIGNSAYFDLLELYSGFRLMGFLFGSHLNSMLWLFCS